MSRRWWLSGGGALLVAVACWAAGMTALSVAYAAVMVAALPHCRPSPRAATVAVLVGCGLAAAAAAGVGPTASDPDSVVVLLVPALVSFFVAREVGGPSAYIAVAAVSVSAVYAGELADPGNFVPVLMPALAAAGSGRAVRSRDLLARALAERAAELDAERDSYAELSVRYERARIAAELHDIVAHAISVMVVQAGAGQRLAARDPEATAQAFRHIGDAAREAQDDLERLVALLADDREDGAPPDLSLVTELVQRAQGSGLDVTLRLEGERGGFSSEVARCAYLVAREGLTNALRYASGAAVDVIVAGSTDGLTVQVRNSPATAPLLPDLGAGSGLRGLRERLGRVGGRLDAGPTADGGWLVQAALPRRAAVPVPPVTGPFVPEARDR